MLGLGWASENTDLRTDNHGNAARRQIFPSRQAFAEAFCQFRCWPRVDGPLPSSDKDYPDVEKKTVDRNGSAEAAAGPTQSGDTFGLPLSGAFGFVLISQGQQNARPARCRGDTPRFEVLPWR